MEFWGVEVKAGEPLKVALNEGRALHLSQACLGEVKKDKGHESVCLFVNVNGKKFVLGTLFSEKLPQQIFDLVFDKEFELSHNWKNGSVFFYGYTADNNPDESDNEDDSESESEEDIPLLVPNGAPASQVKQEKPAVVANSKAGKDSAAAGKQKVKIVEPDEKSEDDEDSSDEDDSMSEDESEDDKDNKSASDEDDDDSDEEETPVQEVKSGKKRASESASKTPVPDKKAKLITPKKTDGKKSNVHVATPHPSKQTGKTPANKPNQQIPKTEGSHSCKPCNRTFKTEMALESHNKAKHSG